jgi:thiol-disulfide isomerase/thioredoxin
MNKSKLFLFLFFFLIANTVFGNTILISGKIKNMNDEPIVLRSEVLYKEIKLQTDGSFSETIDIEFEGLYILYLSNSKIYLYLTNDSKLNIEADNNDLGNTLQFKGNGSVENYFIANKEKIVSTIPEEHLFLKNESDFLNAIKIQISELKKLNEQTVYTDKQFKEKELRDFFYIEQLYYLNYQELHSKYAKIDNYKTSDSFPLFDENINLDNTDDYIFSNAYKQIVIKKFNDKIISLNNGDDENTSRIAVPEIEKIKSQYIKNTLCKSLIFEMRPGNPNFTYIYQSIIANSTDPYLNGKAIDKYQKFEKLTLGKPSPNFNLKDKNGKFVSLQDLQGSYIYIDVWATWCKPCREEIPHLKLLEEHFKDKNIQFVSISVDNPDAYNKWLKLINDKQLGGIQLISENGWDTDFVKQYAIDNIPRFILIDPKGIIINSDAPRPSNNELTILLEKLL